jgi:hypothetical protein
MGVNRLRVRDRGASKRRTVIVRIGDNMVYPRKGADFRVVWKSASVCRIQPAGGKQDMKSVHTDSAASASGGKRDKIDWPLVHHLADAKWQAIQRLDRRGLQKPSLRVYIAKRGSTTKTLLCFQLSAPFRQVVSIVPTFDNSAVHSAAIWPCHSSICRRQSQTHIQATSYLK